MINSNYAIIAIAITAIVTILLRALPFLIFVGNRKTPKVITYLGKVLPYSIMGMLVIYCVKGISFTNTNGWAPTIIASLITVVSYIFKKNTLLSVILGTVVYMVLVQFVFI